MAIMGRSPANVTAVFVSHFHSDHIHGIKTMVKQHSTPILTLFNDNEFHSVGEKGWIRAVPADHDAQCYSFVFGDSYGNKAALITDTNTILCDSLEYFMGCHAILVEANHDMDLLLKNTRYSDDLKIRVAETHLENGQTKDFLEMVAWPGLEYVGLLHLSRMNNTVARAGHEAGHGLRRAECFDAKVFVSTHDAPCRMLSLI